MELEFKTKIDIIDSIRAAIKEAQKIDQWHTVTTLTQLIHARTMIAVISQNRESVNVTYDNGHSFDISLMSTGELQECWNACHGDKRSSLVQRLENFVGETGGQHFYLVNLQHPNAAT